MGLLFEEASVWVLEDENKRNEVRAIVIESDNMGSRKFSISKNCSFIR